MQSEIAGDSDIFSETTAKLPVSEYIENVPASDDAVSVNGVYTDKTISQNRTEALTTAIQKNTAPSDAAKIAILVSCIGSVIVSAWFLITYLTFDHSLRTNRKFYRYFHGVKVYVSENASVPCVAGLIPHIYITEALAGSHAEQMVLGHEYTHLLHGDPIWGIFRAAAVSVFWWNPLVWAAAVLSARDAELACDDAVSSHLNEENRLKYAGILLNTVPKKNRYVISFNGSPLKERILRLTKTQKNRVVCAVLAVLLSVGTVGISYVSVHAVSQKTSGEDAVPDPDILPSDHKEADNNAAATGIPTLQASSKGNTEYPAVMVSGTFDDQMRNIYGILNAYIRTVNAVSWEKEYLPVYSESVQLAMNVLNENTQTIFSTNPVYRMDHFVAIGNFEEIFAKLFKEYPEQAKRETALIEFLRQYCYIYQMIGQFSLENFYQNEEVYDALFPGTKKIITEYHGGDVSIGYEGYHGTIAYVKRDNQINSFHSSLDLCEDAVIISNYDGIVSIVPVNQYGAVGRTSKISVSCRVPDAVHTIVVSGNHCLINPDISSEEFIAVLNNKADRTSDKNWIDDIGNTQYLESLIINHCQMTDAEELFHRITKPRIEALDLSENLLKEIDLTDFIGLYTLELNGNPELSKVTLPDKRSIVRVSLRNTAVDNLEMFDTYGAINALDITNTKIPDLTALTGKIIHQLSFSADATDYHALSGISGINSLDITSERELPDDLMEIVKSIPNLRYFYYNNEPVVMK
ncbi:MAG: hypothetical protein MJ175_08530 [Clostridia bacterium]|nr:hypothetical protein [Clostridia bacterium]